MRGEDVRRPSFVYGYNSAATLVQVLKQAGNDLSRENLLKQANSFPEAQLPLLVPGVRFNTTAEDHTPFHEGQPARFDGTKWVPIGDVIRATVPSGE